MKAKGFLTDPSWSISRPSCRSFLRRLQQHTGPGCWAALTMPCRHSAHVPPDPVGSAGWPVTRGMGTGNAQAGQHSVDPCLVSGFGTCPRGMKPQLRVLIGQICAPCLLYTSDAADE